LINLFEFQNFRRRDLAFCRNFAIVRRAISSLNRALSVKTPILLASALCLSLGGCISTQEMPLAPNVVRLDTSASGLLFSRLATGQTMHRAAELTLQSGYTHFRLDDASLSQGSRYAGSFTSANATAYGNQNLAVVNGSAMSTPIYRPTTSVGVTVIMFHADEPGAKGAFDAAQVLKGMAG
jgi:hypothetical protein